MAKRPSLTTFGDVLKRAEARPHNAPSTPGPGFDTPSLPLPARRRRSATVPRSAVFVRVSPASLAALQDLAKAEGLTMQDLGVYALNLALVRFGREPVVEGAGG